MSNKWVSSNIGDGHTLYLYKNIKQNIRLRVNWNSSTNEPGYDVYVIGIKLERISKSSEAGKKRAIRAAHQILKIIQENLPEDKDI